MCRPQELVLEQGKTTQHREALWSFAKRGRQRSDATAMASSSSELRKLGKASALLLVSVQIMVTGAVGPPALSQARIERNRPADLVAHRRPMLLSVSIHQGCLLGSTARYKRLVAGIAGAPNMPRQLSWTTLKSTHSIAAVLE